MNWERIKADEKGEEPLEDDIPETLPALARAAKVQRRAAGWGFEWRSVDSALEALDEEVAELETHTDADNAEQEVGDVLFATVAVARKLGVDPESALRRTTRGFAERYERFNALLEERGLTLDDVSEDDVRALFTEAARMTAARGIDASGTATSRAALDADRADPVRHRVLPRGVPEYDSTAYGSGRTRRRASRPSISPPTPTMSSAAPGSTPRDLGRGPGSG